MHIIKVHVTCDNFISKGGRIAYHRKFGNSFCVEIHAERISIPNSMKRNIQSEKQ